MSEPSSFGEDGGELEPVAAARLDEVRLKETIVRRTAPGPAQPTTASQYGDVPIAFEFVRSQDRSQRLALAAPDTLVIRAIATGSPAAMPRPTVLPLFAAGRERRPVTVSVAIEGLLFAVRVEAGDTAETTAHRLIDRLDRYYSVELLEAGEQEAVLRLAGLRVGAPT